MSEGGGSSRSRGARAARGLQPTENGSSKPAPQTTRTKTARVITGRIAPPDLPGAVTLAEALSSSLVPSAHITRFRRDWYVGKFQIQGPTVIAGRIGYGSDDSVEVWDQELGDFRTAAVPLGQVSPFAINLNTGRIVFQLRTTISGGAFAGAFASLLDISSSYLGWSVELDEQPETFREFTESVDGIERLSITMLPPNPNYKGRRSVEHLVDGARSALSRLELNGTDINTADSLVAEALAHAESNGRISATGRRQNRRVPWNSENKRATEQRFLPADPITGDASSTALVEEVR